MLYFCYLLGSILYVFKLNRYVLCELVRYLVPIQRTMGGEITVDHYHIRIQRDDHWEPVFDDE